MSRITPLMAVLGIMLAGCAMRPVHTPRANSIAVRR